MISPLQRSVQSMSPLRPNFHKAPTGPYSKLRVLEQPFQECLLKRLLQWGINTNSASAEGVVRKLPSDICWIGTQFKKHLIWSLSPSCVPLQMGPKPKSWFGLDRVSMISLYCMSTRHILLGLILQDRQLAKNIFFLANNFSKSHHFSHNKSSRVVTCCQLGRPSCKLIL